MSGGDKGCCLGVGCKEHSTGWVAGGVVGVVKCEMGLSERVVE